MSKQNKIFKRFLPLFLAVAVSLFPIQAVQAEEAVTNPISLTATEVAEDGTFTVNIRMAQECTMEAFTFQLNYDASKVSLNQGAQTVYGYYRSFLDSYNANHNAICLANALQHETDSYLKFAGAQPVAQTAAVTSGCALAYVQFQMDAQQVVSEGAVEAALRGITLNVLNLTTENENQVALYPELFAAPLYIVGNDEEHGETAKRGDLTGDNAVGLDDAQQILKAALGIISLTGEEMKIADINQDGTVGLDDAQQVLKAALGIISLEN